MQIGYTVNVNLFRGALMVKIITDSASDFEPNELKKLMIDCIPLSVNFGDEEYKDNVTISKDEFFDKLKNTTETVKTSQPSLHDIAEEFEKGGTEDFVARTLAVDRSIWAILQRPYNTSMDSGVSILTRIRERNLFIRIIPIKNLINKTTGKPTQLLLDDTPENYQAIDVAKLGTREWEIGSTSYLAAEEKMSEILPYKPESVMEIETN